MGTQGIIDRIMTANEVPQEQRRLIESVDAWDHVRKLIALCKRFGIKHDHVDIAANSFPRNRV